MIENTVRDISTDKNETLPAETVHYPEATQRSGLGLGEFQRAICCHNLHANLHSFLQALASFQEHWVTHLLPPITEKKSLAKVRAEKTRISAYPPPVPWDWMKL